MPNGSVGLPPTYSLDQQGRAAVAVRRALFDTAQVTPGEDNRIPDLFEDFLVTSGTDDMLVDEDRALVVVAMYPRESAIRDTYKSSVKRYLLEAVPELEDVDVHLIQAQDDPVMWSGNWRQADKWMPSVVSSAHCPGSPDGQHVAEQYAYGMFADVCTYCLRRIPHVER